jgi:hypothetical protein
MLGLRRSRAVRCTSHRTGPALHLRGSVQVLPPRQRHGLARPETCMGHSQDGRTQGIKRHHRQCLRGFEAKILVKLVCCENDTDLKKR